MKTNETASVKMVIDLSDYQMETTTNNHPQAYVGTYGKYNNGDLTGAWIDLIKCGTYDNFLKECYKLHEDEGDNTELMIQDVMYLPDGLNFGETPDKEDFDDIIKEYNEENESEQIIPNCQIIDYSEKAFAVIGDTKAVKDELKAIGGRFNFRLSCGAGWIFPKKCLTDVQALLNGVQISVNNNAKSANKGNYDEVIEKACKALNRDKKDMYAAVELPEGFFVIKKESIETRFCFSDEGAAYEYYKTLDKGDNLKNHFLRNNTKLFIEQIEMLEKAEPYDPVRIECNKKNVHFSWLEYDTENTRFLTSEETKQIKAALEYALDLHKKRLETYLKKYGTSKIYTWSYWVDA
jgi:hypothetical protein